MVVQQEERSEQAEPAEPGRLDRLAENGLSGLATSPFGLLGWRGVVVGVTLFALFLFRAQILERWRWVADWFRRIRLRPAHRPPRRRARVLARRRPRSATRRPALYLGVAAASAMMVNVLIGAAPGQPAYPPLPEDVSGCVVGSGPVGWIHLRCEVP